MIDKDKVKNILVITLSNIGDVILTTSVVNALAEKFPSSHLSVMVGPAAKEIFEGDPRVFELITYNKRIPLRDKLKLALSLRKAGYDLVVDLRNTLFPYLLGSRYRTSPLSQAPSRIHHMMDRHLWKLETLGMLVLDNKLLASPRGLKETGNKRRGLRPCIWIDSEAERYIEQFLSEHGIDTNQKIVAISPGARNPVKRWKRNGFIEVADRLKEELGLKVIMVGSLEEGGLIKDIIGETKSKHIDLSGKTNLKQLGALLRRCMLLISNDSAPMHIATAVGTPVVAIFGPTDPIKYAPTGMRDFVVRKNLPCAPCQEAQCKFTHECMELIEPDQVFEAAKSVLYSR